MENSRMRVVLYCRVGTAEQIDDFAMKAQSAFLREQARRENMDIAAEVHGYETGATLNRPGWSRAVQLAVENGADAILVKDYARIMRNTVGVVREIERLQAQGIDVITADGELLTFTHKQLMEDLRERGDNLAQSFDTRTYTK